MIKEEQHNRIKLIFLIAIIALILLSFMSYVRIQNLISETELVNHTQRVKLELNKTFSSLKEIESSQRGYILTRDTVFLLPVYEAQAKLISHFDKIDSLIKGDPSKQQNVKELRIIVFKRLEYIQRVLEDTKNSTIDIQRFLVGKALMDAVAKQIDKMEIEEDNLLQIRSTALNKSTAITPLFTIVLIIGSIVILFASYFKIMRELRISDRLKLNIERSKNELTKINESILEKNQELIKANKELESINYISSHDLQEPLRQIQNFASRIIDIEQQNLSDKGKNYFEKMSNAAKRMQTLLTDLLTYSKAKTGERKFKTIKLKQIVDEATKDFIEIIDDKNATILVDELCDIKVIPFQFQQMMHNLIGNALKFSKPDTPPKIIINGRIVKLNQQEGSTDLTTETEYYHISVTDNGIGFEPQYKDRIFEVFQRLNDKQKFSGTGIGLAIVKKIVENHNGFITTTSELNKGATFNIYIPTNQNI